ncbi:hypothetical protein FF36_00031 [Frankia torreyi]|uniref:DUF3987 domain-containing protein n=1 Tax=Frankia torreyi TaxID=1856 RepID=A0A0D8BMI0_9ACTN|nr:hypothetical protein FF36_00031 [Frankia torreyi]
MLWDDGPTHDLTSPAWAGLPLPTPPSEVGPWNPSEVDADIVWGRLNGKLPANVVRWLRLPVRQVDEEDFEGIGRHKALWAAEKELLKAGCTKEEVFAVVWASGLGISKFGGGDGKSVRPAALQDQIADAVRSVNEDRAIIRARVAAVSDEPTLTEAVPSGEFWDARPVLSHIRDFARARVVSPWAMFGVVLARVATAIPPTITLPPLIGSKASLNMYINIVDPSGGGKGSAMSSARDCLDLPVEIKTVNLGSGEGVTHQYMERTNGGVQQYESAVMFVVSEVDSLTALQTRSGSTIVPTLCSAWVGEPLGFAYVDKSKRLPMEAHTYRLTLVCGVQPERARSLLDTAGSGLAQRFLWLPATDPDALPFDPSTPTTIPALSWRTPFDRDDLTLTLGVAHPIEIEIRRTHHDRVAGRRTVSPLDAHRNLSRLKIAAILGLLDKRTEVDEEDWQLAGRVLDMSDHTRQGVIQVLASTETSVAQARGKSRAIERVAESNELAAFEATMEWIKAKLADEEITDGEIKRRLPSRMKHHREAALQKLAGLGQIERKPGSRKDSLIWTLTEPR